MGAPRLAAPRPRPVLLPHSSLARPLRTLKTARLLTCPPSGTVGGQRHALECCAMIVCGLRVCVWSTCVCGLCVSHVSCSCNSSTGQEKSYADSPVLIRKKWRSKCLHISQLSYIQLIAPILTFLQSLKCIFSLSLTHTLKYIVP